MIRRPFGGDTFFATWLALLHSQTLFHEGILKLFPTLSNGHYPQCEIAGSPTSYNLTILGLGR